jgi:hypothetical protein
MSEPESKRIDEVRTRRLVLEDDTGRERAVLQMQNGQPVFRMLDDQGHARIQIDLIDGEPEFRIQDAGGEIRFQLFASAQRTHQKLVSPQWKSWISMESSIPATPGRSPVAAVTLNADTPQGGRRQIRAETSTGASLTGNPGPSIAVSSPRATQKMELRDEPAFFDDPSESPGFPPEIDDPALP